MKQTTTYTYARAKSAIAITAIACVVLSHVAGPLAVVPTVEAASSFRPTIFVNTEAFLVIDDDDTTADVVMRFGDTLAKTLTFNRAFDRFEFNDDVYVTGTIQASNTLSGAIVHAQSQLRASGSLVVDGTVIVNNNTINVYRNASAALSLFSDGTTATIQSFSQPMALNPSGNNVGIGKADPRTKLDVVGAISGSFVYATKSFSGAGLTDCDTAGTSKLLWDATTGRFSCGTDQGSAYTAGQGLNLSTTSFRLNTTVTGAVLQAGNVLASSGSLSWKGAGSGKSIAVMQDSYFLGNLGIGTDTPSAKLHATGNIRTDSDLYVLGSDIYSNGILAARSQDEAFIMLDYDNNGSTERFRIAKNSGGDPADVDTLFTIVESGNTGIGTVSPKAKLDVVGIMSGVTLYATKSFSGAGLSDCDTAGTSKLLWDATAGRFSCGTDTDTNTTYTAGQGLNLSASNAFSLKTTVTGAVIQATNSLASSGALTWKGIGSGGRLDVGGGTIQIAANGSAVFNENSQNLDYRFEGDGNANLLFLDASSDRVGIGTATPNYNVEIHGGASFSYISLINNASGLSANDGFQFGLESDASAAYILMRENGPLHFRTNNTNKMSILANGNVGIGTTAPRTKLDVVGAISGSFIYATQSFSGAGLSDCDTAGTSKLLWDATTGRFSCGTDSGAAYTAGQGLSLNGTSFRVNDTLTGSLARFSTVSGSTIFAKDTLASSGSIILKSATGNADMFVTSTVAHANGYFDAATGNNAAIRLR